MLSKVFIVSIIIGTLGSVSACSGHKADLGAKANYHSASKELIRTITTSNDAEVIKKAAMNVADLASPVLDQLTAKNKKCAQISDFIQKKKTEMYDMTPSQLESNYHDGKALPSFPEECHDLKELIVHPATVVSLAKYSKDLAKAKEQMKDEIEEVIGHFESL
tara:strand:- start:407 stop:895 length:489 start_codon:yes stop_codon:yes gene_type:complete